MELAEEPRSVDALRAAVAAGWRPEYVFFWSHDGDVPDVVGRECLSQWYPAQFVVDGVTYATAEHFMMHRKALLFGDDEVAARVLEAAHPGEAKKLGRMVRGFDGERWDHARFDVVVAGNVAKFSQNAALAEYLARTGSRVLVEASPHDTIWGIGLAEKDAGASDVDAWRGLNLLGFALMQVRAMLVAR